MSNVTATELGDLFNAFIQTKNQLSAMIEADVSHPIASLSASDSPEALREEVCVFINDIVYDSREYPDTQIVACISSRTYVEAERFNSLKQAICDQLQMIKKQSGGGRSQAFFRRDPVIQTLMAHMGVSQLDLKKVYRKVPLFGEESLPDAISFSWSRQSRSMKRFDAMEVMNLINESSLPDDVKNDYYMKLGRASKNQATFILARPLAAHQVVNFRFPGRRGWKMMRTSMPVLIRSDHLPVIAFRSSDEVRRSEGRRKVVRQDNCLKDEQLLLPALNIYAR